MPVFTIETTYHLPVFRHRTIEAPTVEEACRLAVEDDDWEGQVEDYETSGETHVTGVWEGADAAHRGPVLPWPALFDELIQRKADHYATLLAILRRPARTMGLSPVEFEQWLPEAFAAVAEADAIMAGRAPPP